MIERNTVEWREAHRGCISVSDAAHFMAKAGSRRRSELVERLVLDREGIEQHTDEHPDPWHEQHEIDIRVAVAAYRRETGALMEVGGIVESPIASWLIASPHGISGEGVLWTRTRRTLRVFHVEQSKLRRADRVRAQLMAWICEREWCDVVDIWSPGLGLPDRIAIARETVNSAWIVENVIPRMTSIWRDVAERLQARRAPPPSLV